MKSLILIFLSPVLFSPCFAEQARYRLQGNGVAKLQTGWVVSDEELKGYVDSKIHPGYGFSDTAVKNGRIIIKIGTGNLVFPSGIKAGKDIIEEPNAFQEIKGKVTMFHNNYASEQVSWSDVVKMYEEAGLMPDPLEAENMRIKVYPFPFFSFSQVGGRAFGEALMDGDGPGNGGGSPSASMKFYFSGETISPEQIKQIQEQLVEGNGAFVMTPFYGMNHILEDEAALFAGKQVLGEDVFVNYWGIMPNEGVQNELLERLMEQAGLMEELEDTRDTFTAYGWNEAFDVGVEFMFEVPESYLREKTGIAYKDYDKGVQFMIGIPQSSFSKKAEIVYEGYGEMGEKWHQNSMEGMNDFSVHFFK